MSLRACLNIYGFIAERCCQEKTEKGNVYKNRQEAKRKVTRMRLSGHPVIWFHCSICSKYHLAMHLSYRERLRIRRDKQAKRRLDAVPLFLLGTGKPIDRVPITNPSIGNYRRYGVGGYRAFRPRSHYGIRGLMPRRTSLPSH